MRRHVSVFAFQVLIARNILEMLLISLAPTIDLPEVLSFEIPKLSTFVESSCHLEQQRGYWRQVSL